MATTFNGNVGPPELTTGASAGCYSPDLDISILAGTADAPAWSDDNGATWNDAISGGPFPGTSRCCVWISALSLFIVSGDGAFIAYSADGKNWSITMAGINPYQALGTPPNLVTALSVSYGNGLFVISGGGQGSTSIASATDPTDYTTFTQYSGTPFDTGQAAVILWVAAWSLWLAAGDVANVAVAATSPDLSTWTTRTTTIDGASSTITCAIESSIASAVLIGGASPNANHAFASSGALPSDPWTSHAIPFDAGGIVNGIAETASLIYAVGFDGAETVTVVETTGDLDSWTSDTSPLDPAGFGNTIFGTSSDVIVAGFAGSGGAGPADQGAAPINAWEHKYYISGQLVTPTTPNGHTYKASTDGPSGPLVFIGTTAAVAPFTLEPTWHTDSSDTPDGYQTWIDLGTGITGVPTPWADETAYGEGDLVTPPTPDGHFYIPYPGCAGTTGTWPNINAQSDPWTSPYEGSDGTNNQGANFPAGGLDPTDSAYSSTDGTVFFWQDLGSFAATEPAAPVLAALTPGNTVMDLSWSTPADGGSAITGYNVYRGTSPGGETLLVGLGVTNSFHDTGLTNGVTYYYVVTAVNVIGESGFSNEQSAVPGTIVPPGAPTLDTAVGGNLRATLTWTAPGSDGGSPVTAYKLYRGTSPGGEVLVAVLGDVLSYTDLGLINGQVYYYKVSAVNIAGESTLSNELFTTPFAPAPFARFFEGYEWRFLFADIPAPDAPIPSPGGITTTWCDGLLTNRQIALVLNQASVITADVWPDNNRVNKLFPRDSFPLVAPNSRVIYAFRREAPEGGPRWVCRAAGLLMNVEDQGDPDIPLSHLTAYDPWKFLEGRPVMNAAGALPSASYSFRWFATRANIIACQLLRNTIMAPIGGGFCFVDAGDGSRSGEGPQYQDWGGTPFYQGTIQSCDEINFEAQQGMMVADAWNGLCTTGYFDIVLTPIYDPINRPGYTHELNIYRLAGTDRLNAVFAWDKLMRSASNADRMHSGTPGDFVNIVEYYVGQGGFPTPPQINMDSLNQYLAVWSQQFFASQSLSTGDAVLAMAQQALTLGKQGKRTMTLVPTPERSPIPLTGYGLGDRVQVYATSNLRVEANGPQRIQGIPISVTDDGIEQISALLCSPDWREVL